VKTIERAVVGPKIEIAVNRALGRQILGDRPPLTARRENIHEAVHDLAYVHLALAAAALCRRDQGPDQRPLRVRDIAGITQTATVVASTIFIRPHLRPLRESGRPMES